MVILYWEGYRHYKLNKKALENASKTLMVELVGTAPTSASLSWLGFYRHRSFEIYQEITDK